MRRSPKTGSLFPAVSFLCFALAATSHASSSKFRVVIDPGHGGSDLGTYFNQGRARVAEKDVTLVLAREAARQLRSKGYEVVLTRDGDKEISLSSRTALANRLHADIFLSLHMNSPANHVMNPQAEGIETYILNNATDASSKRLAHLENTVLTSTESNDLGTDNLDVALILKDLRLDANLAESKRLACALQSNLIKETAREKQGRKPASISRNRGVKQALFHVLLGADMPSVLIEAGFLSNSKDRSMVMSSTGQNLIGQAIAKAVDQYRQHLRGTAQAMFELSNCRVN